MRLETRLELTLADDRTLGYAEYGDADGWPLVYLHGFPGSRLAGGVLDRAARTAGVRVLAPERPGIGLSSPQPGRTLLDHAQDVLALVTAVGIERFAVLGESGGGPYALACALALPAQATAAAVVCGLGPIRCAGWTEGIAIKERIGYAIAARAPLLAGRALVPVAAWARRRPRAFLHVTGLQLADADRTALAGPLGDLVAADFAEAFRQGGRGVGRDLALLFRAWPFNPGEIRVPVVFFHGTDDRTVSLAATRGLAERVPTAELRVFERHGHFSLLAEEGDEVLRTLRQAARRADLAEMARIEGYEFGRVLIDGEEHRQDVIVLPNRVLRGWWRRNGHALILEDLDDVLDELPERLVVGTGAYGRLRPDPAAIAELRRRGIEVDPLPTADAVRLFAQLDPTRTAAALHLTC